MQIPNVEKARFGKKRCPCECSLHCFPCPSFSNFYTQTFPGVKKGKYAVPTNAELWDSSYSPKQENPLSNFQNDYATFIKIF
jgi:hypothetical protein